MHFWAVFRRRSGPTDRRLRLLGRVVSATGVVQRAVIEVLAQADRPMDVGEAHTTVEGLLGYPVSRDSVNSCLSTGARGARPNFQRVGPGRYRLKRAA